MRRCIGLVVVFANKVDLVEENYSERTDIEKVVEKHHFLGYYITSAKIGQGVVDAFNSIINELYLKNKGLSTD